MITLPGGTRLVGRVALAVLAAFPAAAVAQEATGITFDISTGVRSGTDSTSQTGKGWVTTERMRLDLRGTGSTIGTPGDLTGENNTILLHRDAEQRNAITVVNHDTRHFMSPARMIEQMTAMMVALPPEMRPRISLEIRNIRVDTLGLGETISGFVTRHFKTAINLGLRIEVAGQRQEHVIRIESDAMYSEELAEFAIMSQWSRNYETVLGPMMGTDSTALSTFRRMGEVFPRGIPLRSEDRLSFQQGPQVEFGTASMTSVSNIKRASFPRSVFDIPAGYTEMENPRMPSN